jgi:RNA polymerase sigma-70 factor (ECF subfamily)
MDYLTAWQNKVPMLRVEGENVAETAVFGERSDRQLVDLVLAGDECAFEYIFERYKRHVAITASRYVRKPEQIEEIIQIAFSKAYFELKNFRGSYDFSLASWLGRIAANACLDTLRSQKRKPLSLISELSDEEKDFLERDLPRNESGAEKLLVQRDMADKLLSHLDGEDRALLQMLYAEEMTVAEIADVTGWSRPRIKVRAFRARHMLRKVLKKYL